MKTLTSILFLLLAQSAQATATPESVIKLQITSLDAHLADTAHQSGVMDATESQWLNKSERVLVGLMAHNKALAERLRHDQLRHELLRTIYYEAKRSGLDPDLVLAVIRVESKFRKYAISSAGARGYMQIMVFWADIVGEQSSDLFNVKTNLRLGCAILRSYLDKENGNVHRALARYNGSLGKNDYPNLIYAAWVNWATVRIRAKMGNSAHAHSI
jgi:soluble lytic murein transglycosylase-like protein